MSQIGTIDAASREMRQQVELARQRRREREQVDRLVRLTDAIVDELERLNLDEVRRVNGAWRGRLARLFSALPFPYTPWLRAHPSPTEVLDVLFDIQARLLDMKRGRPARAAGRGN